MKMSPLVVSDGYKQSHRRMDYKGLRVKNSNTTPRKSRLDGVNSVVVWGLQYWFKEYLIKQWKEEFFDKDIEDVLKEYKRIINSYLGPGVVDDESVRYLHSLGHLPLEIKALPEGTLCPIQVPFMVIENTDKKCPWIVNFLETISQTIIWQPITSATIAREYRRILNKYAEETSDSVDFVDFQGHDFSMRGMSSLESACTSGSGHALFFKGSDTIPVIPFLEEYYNADCEKELIVCSVPATEHAIQCQYYEEGDTDELPYVKTMMERFPEGILSIVADGFDFWDFLTNTMPKLKDKIMARNGKIVVRPDSGCPVKIVSGYFLRNTELTADEIINKSASDSWLLKNTNDSYDGWITSDGKFLSDSCEELTESEVKGAIQVLYDEFGGTTNSKGYIDLDPHVGLIYGDSITLDRCEKICERLKRRGFASTNVVYGIGSYTYQYNTRDTLGLACKATWIDVDGKGKDIYKDPKTGSGMKKSARGLLRVNKTEDSYELQQRCTRQEYEGGELKTVFLNGKLVRDFTLNEVRKKVISEC